MCSKKRPVNTGALYQTALHSAVLRVVERYARVHPNCPLGLHPRKPTTVARVWAGVPTLFTTGRKIRIDIWTVFNYNLTENKTQCTAITGEKPCGFKIGGKNTTRGTKAMREEKLKWWDDIYSG